MKAVSGQPGTPISEPTRSRTLRFAGVAAAAVAAVFTLSSCAAGQHAATAIDKPAIAGTTETLGNIELQNVSIQAPNISSRETGTKFYAVGDTAPMTLTLINVGHSADTLTSVTSPAFTSWAITSSDTATQPSGGASSQVLNPNVAVSLGIHDLGVGTGTSEQTLVLRGLTAAQKTVYPGSTVDVTFTFAKAGSITLHVPVDLTSDAPTDSIAPGSSEEPLP